MNPSDKIIFGIHAVVSVLNETGFFPDDELYVQKNPQNPRIRNLFFKAKKSEIIIHHTTFREITAFCGNSSHQGIVLKRTQNLGIELQSEEDLFDLFHVSKKADANFPKIVVALDKVTDPGNAGAVVRSMGAFDSVGLVIGKKNSVPVGPTMMKTSAGVLPQVSIFSVGSIWRTASKMRQKGIPVIGLDMQGEDIKVIKENLREKILKSGLMLIAGSEEKGLSREVRNECDHIVRINHHANVESLNVSVAVSIALYEITREYF